MTATSDELPNGLKVLLFVGAWRGSQSTDEAVKLFQDIRTVYGTAGFVTWIKGTKSPAFLREIGLDSENAGKAHIVIGFIGSPDVLKKWFHDGDDYYMLEKVAGEELFGGGGADERIEYYSNQLLSSLSPLFKADVEIISRGISLRERSSSSQIGAAQTSDDVLATLSELEDTVGCDISHQAAAVRRHDKYVRTEVTSFLVPGLIPYGAVTLLLGNKKVGKSALGLELEVAVARREKTWAGFPLNHKNKGIAVYLAGEDTLEETLTRVRQMTDGSTPYTLWLENGSDLDAILNDLAGQKVTLLVVDPARKYFKGDEDGSDAVSGFYTKLEDFARKTGAAVVVTHHLKRYAEPRNVSDVANHYRGSSVFLDRPRVTLAVHRAGNETHVAIPVLGGTPLHNFRQADMFSGVRRLRRDEKTFRHLPIGETAANAVAEVSEETLEQVFGATTGVLVAGERLTRTGSTGLYERKLPALKALSRASVRAAVDALVGQGRLHTDAAGTVTAAATSSTDGSNAVTTSGAADADEHNAELEKMMS
jgi:hypothetical protein